MTISVAELKGRDDGSSADYKRLSTLPLQKLRKTSAHEKGDQDSESVSQDTRSRSSDTEKVTGRTRTSLIGSEYFSAVDIW